MRRVLTLPVGGGAGGSQGVNDEAVFVEED
jgi:hypothetical protein